MKTYAKTVAVIIVAIIVSSLWTGAVGAANVQISGSVTNQSGFGIASVTVAVIDPLSGNTVASAMTNASGNYTVSVASGMYTIKATPLAGSNYQTATVSNQTIATDIVINLMLTPVTGTAEVKGQIRDGLGNGLPNQIISDNYSNGTDCL